ncbi:hypothetical protein [Myxococcus phage Mx1]|nr:hypothetical protein [Myxococcus phage Mx1]
MFEMRLEQVINQIVQSQLPDNAQDGKALYLNFDIRISSYEDGVDITESAGLHLLYSCRPGGSYITVFSGVTESPFDSAKDVKEWKHVTTHDSCWRENSELSRLYFKLCESVNAGRDTHSLYRVPPAQLHQNIFFPLGTDTLFKWVDAEIKTDPNDTRNYRKLLKLL